MLHLKILTVFNGNFIWPDFHRPFLTGLGLSLAYDIIKAHGGEVRVETTEGKGTEFIIILNS